MGAPKHPQPRLPWVFDRWMPEQVDDWTCGAGLMGEWLGVSRAVIGRWRKFGIPLVQADEVAIKITGRMPYDPSVWGVAYEQAWDEWMTARGLRVADDDGEHEQLSLLAGVA